MIRRDLAFAVGDRQHTASVCTPSSSVPPGPLVLLGHGFMMDRLHPFPTPSIESLVNEHGFTTACLDAPGHGLRASSPDASAERRAEDYRAHWREHQARHIRREFDALADFCIAQKLSDDRVGYWGLSLGTQYGLGWLAKSEHPRAAVMGLFGQGPVVAHYARSVRCPVFFIQQIDDELHSAERTGELYAEIASEQKTLAASPGAHVEVPLAVLDRAVEFLIGHLKR